MEDARKRRLVTAVDDENSFEPPRKKGALASASEQVNGDSSAIDEGLEVRCLHPLPSGPSL